MITRLLAPRANRAVPAVPRPLLVVVVVLVAMVIASDEPSESMRISRSLWRRRPAFVSALHITPDDMITRRLDTSQRSGSASRARSVGLAMASPTMAIDFTRSRWMVSSSSTTSK